MALEARSRAAAASEAAGAAEAMEAAAGRGAFEGAARELAVLQAERRELSTRWGDATEAFARSDPNRLTCDFCCTLPLCILPSSMHRRSSGGKSTTAEPMLSLRPMPNTPPHVVSYPCNIFRCGLDCYHLWCSEHTRRHLLCQALQGGHCSRPWKFWEHACSTQKAKSHKRR